MRHERFFFFGFERYTSVSIIITGIRYLSHRLLLASDVREHKINSIVHRRRRTQRYGNILNSMSTDQFIRISLYKRRMLKGKTFCNVYIRKLLYFEVQNDLSFRVIVNSYVK